MTDLALKPTENVKKVYTSPDTLRQQNPFYPTYYEWLSKRGEQIIKYGGCTSSTQPIYTVPLNSTLFITSAYIENFFNGDAVTGVSASLYVLEEFGIIGTCIKLGFASHQSNSLSFPIPIKINSNSEIKIGSGANNQVKAGFTGFLVPNNLIPQF